MAYSARLSNINAEDFPMQHRSYHGLLNALMVAALAAAVVVPLPAAACRLQADGSGCCCKSHDQTERDTSRRCHPSATFDTCVSPSCGCCRAPEPQTTPPEHTTVQPPTGPVAFLPTDAVQLHGGIEFASGSEAAPDGHLAAIPHRILHCSWLI